MAYDHCKEYRRGKGCPPQVLLPQIMGSGRQWHRCWRGPLKITGLDACARPPFTLASLRVAKATAWGGEGGCCRLVIDLECEIRDGCGILYTGSAQITLHPHIHLHCPQEACWRYQWHACACVRLAGCPPCSHTLCFEAALEIMAEVYLIKWCQWGQEAPPKPACPQLPLYPPPVRG